EVLKQNQNRIRIIQCAHSGPAAARNAAIEAAAGELIAFMDADDLCTPDRLRLSVEKLETERLHLVASALSFIDSSGKALPGIWTCPPQASNDYWGALLERNWMGTPSVLVRRSVLEKVGLFDENFTNAEDYDLWLRIGQDHSHSIGFIDAPLIRCRRHSSNTSIHIERHQHFERLALQKVGRRRAHQALCRLHEGDGQAQAEAWIWFLLRRGDAAFRDEATFAISRYPESDSMRFALGVFQHDAGQYTEALRTFIFLKRRDTAALHNVGVLMALYGDPDAGAAHIQTALELQPDYYDARQNLTTIQNGGRLRITRRPFRPQPVAMILGGLL
ncbi:MAG TPA: glycosyltransferase, partial [Terriglobia bacterium]|nr:glycosyltransferase [Terriglobia bacterium]